MERRVFRNYYKGQMDKIKGKGGGEGARWVWLRWCGGVGRKCGQLKLNKNKKKKTKMAAT